MYVCVSAFVQVRTDVCQSVQRDVERIESETVFLETSTVPRT